MREDSVPIEFAELAKIGHGLHYVRRVSHNEWHSSCPFCGEAGHGNYGKPDRFIMLLRSSRTGKPFGWCRRCDQKWWAGKGERHILTAEEIAEWKRAQHEQEMANLQRQQYAVDVIMREKKWIEYHHNLTPDIREHYYKRGIPDFWIDYLHLGYCPDFTYYEEGEEKHSDTLTIPIFEAGTERVTNIRHRIIKPNNGSKYRPERSGVPSRLYVVEHGRKLSGKTIIVEGEFKAMTTYITLDDPNINVVGIPGCTPDPVIFGQLERCDPIYLILDPDAYISKNGIPPIERLIENLGHEAWIIDLPGKVDDLIMAGLLDKTKLANSVKIARLA